MWEGHRDITACMSTRITNLVMHVRIHTFKHARGSYECIAACREMHDLAHIAASLVLLQDAFINNSRSSHLPIPPLRSMCKMCVHSLVLSHEPQSRGSLIFNLDCYLSCHPCKADKSDKSYSVWHVTDVDNLCLTQQAGTKSIQAHRMVQVPLCSTSI